MKESEQIVENQLAALHEVEQHIDDSYRCKYRQSANGTPFLVVKDFGMSPVNVAIYYRTIARDFVVHSPWPCARTEQKHRYCKNAHEVRDILNWRDL